MTEADYDNIDCLLCHAPGYKRTVTKDGNKFRIVPDPSIDILKAAQSVGKPTNDICLRCHAGAGGGPNHKHGVTPTRESDVHVARGMLCVDCHCTEKHRIPGGADIKAQELTDIKTACENCHSSPHEGEQAKELNRHTARIACQTCHIPSIARDSKMPTIVERDWTKPVLNEKTGLFGPTNRTAGNVRPEYAWWNRYMKVPPEPVGSIGDPKAKIYPWKRTDYTVIGDAATGKPVFIKSGAYAVTGDPGAAAKKGAEDSKQNYSGTWKGIKETMVFSLNHQVAPKSEALSCASCHGPKGVLDFRKLGYGDEKIGKLIGR
ncbi:MAG: hypothetical protein HY896_13985 [Deltaproteobacteria bacterium]|nr:hypothetical protein [Deltaproteobacteria bacterium]